MDFSIGGWKWEAENSDLLAFLFTLRLFLIMQYKAHNIISFLFFSSKTYLTLLLKGSIRNLGNIWIPRLHCLLLLFWRMKRSQLGSTWSLSEDPSSRTVFNILPFFAHKVCFSGIKKILPLRGHLSRLLTHRTFQLDSSNFRMSGTYNPLSHRKGRVFNI